MAGIIKSPIKEEFEQKVAIGKDVIVEFPDVGIEREVVEKPKKSLFRKLFGRG